MKKNVSFLLLLIVTIFTLSSCFSHKMTNKVVFCFCDNFSVSEIELQIFEELNLARTNPNLYATFLEKDLKKFRGLVLKKNDTLNKITKEGISAYYEAINYLKNQRSMKPLLLSKCLSKAAQDHCIDSYNNNLTGHIGSNNSDPFARITKYVHGLTGCGENINYGTNNPREIIINLIVDDGVPDRGHRKNIFNDSYKQVGIALGEHKKYRYMCVMDFSVDIIEERKILQ